MKAGQYYIGDLCYVFSNETWQKVCDITIADNKSHEGEFDVDGKAFALHRTAYGDGVYETVGGDGSHLGVDSGTIGCVLVKDMEVDLERAHQLGMVIDMPYGFSTKYDDGTIHFGRITVETDPKLTPCYQCGDDFKEDELDHGYCESCANEDECNDY